MGTLLIFASMFKGLLQSINVIKDRNIQLILSPCEIPQTIILAFLSSRITRRRFVVFLNSFPYYGLIGVFPFENKVKKNFFGMILKDMKIAGYSQLRVIFEASVWYIAIWILNSSTTQIICLSPVIANELSTLNIKGHVIPVFPGNGIDYNEISVVEPKTNEKRYDAIYAAGSIHPQKGIYDVVKIWSKVIEKHPKANLAIAGFFHDNRPHMIEELNTTIYDSNLHNNVTIVCDLNKGLPQKDLWKEMKSAKIFLYPSKKDVWPLVIGEALACGLPVITYDLPGIRNSYGDCLAIFLHKDGDIDGVANSLIDLLNDTQSLEVTSQKAKQYAENHCWNHVVELERKAYLKILEK